MGEAIAQLQEGRFGRERSPCQMNLESVNLLFTTKCCSFLGCFKTQKNWQCLCQCLVSAAFPLLVFPAWMQLPADPWLVLGVASLSWVPMPDAGQAGTGLGPQLKPQPPDGAGPRCCPGSRTRPRSCRGSLPPRGLSPALSSARAPGAGVVPRRARRSPLQPETPSAALCAQ